MISAPLLFIFLSVGVGLHHGFLLPSKYVSVSIRSRLSHFQLGSVAIAASSQNNLHTFEDSLAEFDLLLQSDNCDAQLASRLHLDAILTLVKSDVQDRVDDDGSESHFFPESYLTALSFIVSHTVSLKEKKSPLYASANMISKKEGLSQVIKSVKSVKKQLMSSREIVEVKRKTERVLSQLMTLSIAYRSCVLAGTDKDFLYFTKGLLEKTPIHDRHFALLLFGRGLLAPPYAKPNGNAGFSGGREPLIDVSAVIRGPVLGLSQSFKRSMGALGIAQPSVSARILYPFAAAAIRAFNSESSRQVISKKDDDWFSNDMSGADENRDLQQGITDIDLKLAQLLLACINEDAQAEKMRAMVGSGDEVLSTLRRWICDLAATHFMNDEEGLFSTRDSLPEEVKKNTIAMELLCTERAFCDGKKRDRARFLSLFVEVGNYLDVLISLLETKSTDQSSALQPSLQPSSKFTFHVKKTIAAISATKFLPRTHKLRVGMENGGANSFIGAYNADKRKKTIAAAKSVRESGVGVSRDGEAQGEEDMWAKPKKGPRISNMGGNMGTARSVKREDESDDDIWSAKTTKQKEKDKKTKDTVVSAVAKDFHLVEQVDDYLLQIVAEVLRTSDAVLQQQHVKDEVDYVFSTWRRPHLLLDYYRMHSSTPEIQNNFRRFLSALFGVSGETVEDIRYGDAGNRCHFDLLPKDLSSTWIEGRTSIGEMLPGYCDPQTLFMIGEDSNTCMGVRARQKGSNRGLLSMLLHGNCRILGLKDSHGRLTARAVGRLLIDDATSLPVLYVETPYGSVDEDSYVSVYDQAAELGRLLRVPVIYASPPSSSLYVMGPREISATYSVSETVNTHPSNSHYSHAADWMIEDDDEEEEDDEGAMIAPLVPLDAAESPPVKEKVELCTLLDYTDMATHVWIDGIRDPSSGRYIVGHSPFLFLTKKALSGGSNKSGKEIHDEVLSMGGRPVGVLEKMMAEGAVSLQPSVVRSDQKAKVEEISKSSNPSPSIVPVPPRPIPVPAVVFDNYASVDDENEDADDDDFFGAPSTTAYKVRPQKSLVPVVALEVPTAVPVEVAVKSRNVDLEEAFEPTAWEVEDNRKSKKQRLVSVQARLAERQRLIVEAHQRRQGVITSATKSKADQIKELQLRKEGAESVSSPISDSVSASNTRESYSLRTARTSVPGEVIQLVKDEIEEPVAEDDDDDSDGLWA